jgi:hypothetical protein
MNPEYATKLQKRDWNNFSAMRLRLEGELLAVQSMARTYPDAEEILKKAIAIAQRYSNASSGGTNVYVVDPTSEWYVRKSAIWTLHAPS